MGLSLDKLKVTSLLFLLCTWGFLFSNLLIAWLPSLSFFFLLLRDSWLLLLIILMVVKKRYVSIYLYFCILFIGLLPLIYRHDVAAIKTAFYGIRDISLYFLIAELLLLSNSLTIKIETIKVFLYFIFYIILLTLIIDIFLAIDLTEVLFRTSTYFKSKGVDSNLSSGLFGDRLSVPFYSSALVCTLFSVVYLFQNNRIYSKKESVLALFFSILTLSKVLLFVLAFRLMGEKWKRVFFLLFLFLIPFLVWLNSYRTNITDGILSYHLASTFHHIKAFYLAFEVGLLDFYPDLIGSHSVAGKNFLEIDMYTIESSFLTRVLDLKIYSLFFFVYIAYVFFMFNNKLKSKFYFMFLLLMSLTATSNHPVAYIPFIFLFSNINNSTLKRA
ncbi:hypothetical protein HC000_05975 [Pseudoalteromonas sp. MIP2626]|uniref:hypothetical protein n=1 Tax=Pseudoalteromonas sp. MIP2626 TaxID=2705464 RepID=UPI0015C7A612|nr:hypothetical protein [Pseudoalteromonas sp. MIP2626]NYR12050.1 hypothetical protein [Pseudoalteromonas sp. MIP2626]